MNGWVLEMDDKQIKLMNGSDWMMLGVGFWTGAKKKMSKCIFSFKWSLVKISDWGEQVWTCVGGLCVQRFMVLLIFGLENYPWLGVGARKDIQG